MIESVPSRVHCSHTDYGMKVAPLARRLAALRSERGDIG